jgi:phenylalanyl-tRNA synthetase alpha chain
MDSTTNLTGRMDVRDSLSQVQANAAARIEAAASLEELNAIEAESVGKGSPVAEARRTLGSLPDDERREAGRFINEVAQTLTSAIEARRDELAGLEEEGRLAAERFDVTLPSRMPARGSRHIIREVMNEIVDIFVSIGYEAITGPEAETDYYSFTALNIPPTHPARLSTDTLYLEYGDVPEEINLRPHTSPMQVRHMEETDPPVYVVVPGRVFRRDPLDPTHSPVFHQIEGLAVDENITFGDLKGTLAYFAREFFGPDTKVKFLPSYFPFTEPSAEMYAYANGEWLELLGCGMVNPAVFEYVGYDPERVTGFAFGMGADRMAMVRHGVTDLRHLFDPDVRTLRQFR